MKWIALALMAMLSACAPELALAQQAVSSAMTATGTVGVPLFTGGNAINTVNVSASGAASGLGFAFQVATKVDGSNAITLDAGACTNQPGSTPASGLTTDGNWRCNVAGYAWFGVNVTAITSGTETFRITGSSASHTNGGLSPTIGRNTSTLTRPANTTAYAGSAATAQLVGSSTTAGSVAVPSFAIGTSGGSAVSPVGTLTTNVTTGWSGVSLLVTLWNAAPTYTNGDGGTYAVATGAANFAAQYSCTLIQFGDGAACNLVPITGGLGMLQPASGTSVSWDIQIQSAATPISGQTFTLKLAPWN